MGFWSQLVYPVDTKGDIRNKQSLGKAGRNSIVYCMWWNGFVHERTAGGALPGATTLPPTYALTSLAK